MNASSITFTLPAADLDGFRTMLREQSDGDAELLVHYARERPASWSRQDVLDRLAMVAHLEAAVTPR